MLKYILCIFFEAGNTYLGNYQSNFQSGLKPLFYNQPLVSKLLNSQQQLQQQQQRNPDLNGHYHYVNNHQITRSMRNSSNSVDHLLIEQTNHQNQNPAPNASISNSSAFISTPSIYAQSSEQPNPSDAIIKCTYTNEINKDELPRPNFVSSVKNLFEKQIHVANNAENLNGVVIKTSHHVLPTASSVANPSVLNAKLNQTRNQTAAPQVITQLTSGVESSPIIIESNLSVPVSPSTSSPSSATSSSDSSDSMPSSYSLKNEAIVDMLKQNGTLVYEHTEVAATASFSLSNEINCNSFVCLFFFSS